MIPTYAKLGSILTCGYTSLISFMYFSQAHPFHEFHDILSATSIAGLVGVACIIKYSITNDNNEQRVSNSDPINYYAITPNPLLSASAPQMIYQGEPEGRYVP